MFEEEIAKRDALIKTLVQYFADIESLSPDGPFYTFSVRNICEVAKAAAKGAYQE
jgi:hypothetical protein